MLKTPKEFGKEIKSSTVTAKREANMTCKTNNNIVSRRNYIATIWECGSRNNRHLRVTVQVSSRSQPEQKQKHEPKLRVVSQRKQHLRSRDWIANIRFIKEGEKLRAASKLSRFADSCFYQALTLFSRMGVSKAEIWLETRLSKDTEVEAGTLRIVRLRSHKK
jgi:hypothetical protein